MNGVEVAAGHTGLEAFDPSRHNPTDFLAAWFECLPKLDDDARHQFGRYYAGYLKRFDPYMRRSYDRRLEPLMRHANPGTRVLEVGSGCGSESLLMAIRGCDVTGLELHKQRLHTARQRLGLLAEATDAPLSCRFLTGSLFDDDRVFGDAKGFDLIWMEEVFHHLEPRNRVAARIAELTRPGGRVVIAETNGLNPLMQLSLFRARGLPKIRTFTDDNGRVHQYGVERITSARRLVRLFEDRGFETEFVRHERLFPNLGMAPRALMALERGLQFLPRPSFVHYSYVGRRAG